MPFWAMFWGILSVSGPISGLVLDLRLRSVLMYSLFMVEMDIQHEKRRRITESEDYVES